MISDPVILRLNARPAERRNLISRGGNDEEVDWVSGCFGSHVFAGAGTEAGRWTSSSAGTWA